MKTDAITAAMLEPILSRVRQSSCCAKSPGEAPWRRVKKVTHPDGTETKLDVPLKPAFIEQHIDGTKALGVYPMEPGATTTRIALLDLDSHKGEVSWEGMVETSQALIAELEANFYSPVPFRSSGGNGIHIYLVWAQPQDARSVRGMLTDALAAIGHTNGAGGLVKKEIEVFPKQNSVPANGYGNMFIVPWAGKSCALDVATLAPITPYQARFDVSPDVPVLPAEEFQATTYSESTEEDVVTLRAALDAIPNSGEQELSYSDWRDIIFAIHYTTDGSDEGLALAHTFSERSSKFDPEFLDNRVWPYVSNEQERPITLGTVKHHASRYGWSEDITDKFDVIDTRAEADTDEAVPAEMLVYDPDTPWPKLKRDKSGEILSTVVNVERALQSPVMMGLEISYDMFRDEIMHSPAGKKEWQAFKDADYWRLRSKLEMRGFAAVGSTMIREAVNFVADENRFDSAVTWLNDLKHDGVARIETFLTDYFGVKDSAYTRAVSRYMWTALAGRILRPGVQADMVPVLVGAEGLGKSTGIKAMVPAPEQYTEIAFDTKNDDNARRMRGVLVGEIGELKGLQTKEEEAILTFITRTHEKWTPKYKEFAAEYPRRFLMIGTTNIEEFLDAGRRNRRWLPLRAGQADPEGIARDHALLWAEARDAFEKNGVEWSAAQGMSHAEHDDFQIVDGWDHIVSQWLDETELGSDEARSVSKEGFRLEEILTGPLGILGKDITRLHQRRLGTILRKYKYEPRQGIKAGKNAKLWFPA